MLLLGQQHEFHFPSFFYRRHYLFFTITETNIIIIKRPVSLFYLKKQATFGSCNIAGNFTITNIIGKNCK